MIDFSVFNEQIGKTHHGGDKEYDEFNGFMKENQIDQSDKQTNDSDLTKFVQNWQIQQKSPLFPAPPPSLLQNPPKSTPKNIEQFYLKKTQIQNSTSKQLQQIKSYNYKIENNEQYCERNKANTASPEEKMKWKENRGLLNQNQVVFKSLGWGFCGGYVIGRVVMVLLGLGLLGGISSVDYIWLLAEFCKYIVTILHPIRITIINRLKYLNLQIAIIVFTNCIFIFKCAQNLYNSTSSLSSITSLSTSLSSIIVAIAILLIAIDIYYYVLLWKLRKIQENLENIDEQADEDGDCQNQEYDLVMNNHD